MNPLVSIIIPTYNRSDKLIRCLKSIVDQSYPKIEIIVIDDGSTDDTQVRLKEFIIENSLNDKLFVYSQENKGAPTARNNGLKKARGSLIVFFDSDDIMLPDRILKQVNILVEEDSDCSACGFVYSRKGRQYIPHVNINKGIIGSYINWELVGSTLCWMYKREKLLEIGGYDLSYACYQDWDITFRYLTKCHRISLVQEILNIADNEHLGDRITTQVKSNKRTPHIQRYYLTVLKWLVEESENIALFDDVLFSYVHQITLKYYRSGMKIKALESYKLLIEILNQASFNTALICQGIFFKHLLKSNLKFLFRLK